MNTYYEIQAKFEGEIEILFGSFDRSDCAYELEAEKESWKDQGYKQIKIVSRQTEESPDPEVYGDEAYTKAICKALKNPDITINVSDTSENYFDLENSRDLAEIIEACEATDSPVVNFILDGGSIGYMLVLVGYGEESIVDYPCNDFMNSIVE
jgi:hypothetical protein